MEIVAEVRDDVQAYDTVVSSPVFYDMTGAQIVIRTKHG